MIKKICDMCKKSQTKDNLEMRPPYIANVTIEKIEGWEYVIGRKYKFEICIECFDSFISKTK